MLTELWLSEEFPAYQMMRENAESWAGTSKVYSSSDMDQAYAFDPRIASGMKRLVEELRGVEGTPLKTVSHVVSVPYGQEFDRKLALKDANRSLADDAADTAVDEAGKSVRGAIGGITRGRFGRKKKEPEKPKPKPKQATFMRVVSEVTECTVAPLGDELFEPPADYENRSEM